MTTQLDRKTPTWRRRREEKKYQIRCEHNARHFYVFCFSLQRKHFYVCLNKYMPKKLLFLFSLPPQGSHAAHGAAFAVLQNLFVVYTISATTTKNDIKKSRIKHEGNNYWLARTKETIIRTSRKTLFCFLFILSICRKYCGDLTWSLVRIKPFFIFPVLHAYSFNSQCGWKFITWKYVRGIPSNICLLFVVPRKEIPVCCLAFGTLLLFSAFHM